MNIGERVGDYEIVAILGKGGMGEVYKVRNVLSDRIEAMKVLLPDVGATDPSLAERFQREIRVQAALDHPNIAKLHTALRYENQLLMVMEFIEGVSLEKQLQQGPIGFREAIEYAAQVLDALGYAHGRGVVHRDIKPANIMRTTSGQVKLLDFGIARMTADRGLTQTGHTLGSLYYMSPEQIKGTEPDPRSDLYSLGITLYEMVTGRKPFQGDSAYSLMAAHLEQAPQAPVEVVPGVPPALSDIIVMSMAKDPAQRFQTAQAFAGAIRSLAGSNIAAAPPPPLPVFTMPLPQPPPVPVPVVKTSSRRGLYMALGSVATLLVLAAAAIEGPKYFRARAGGGPAQEAAAQTAAPPPVVTPAEMPSQSPAQTPAATDPVPTAVQHPALESRIPAVTPQREPPRVQGADSPPLSPPETAAPRVRSPEPPVSQPATPQPVVPQQSRPAPPMNEFREEYNLLSIRAGAAKSGLRSMEQQLSRQGLGLRGDVKESESRMDYMLKEAMASIRNADPDGAKRNLQMATNALESIEKFLGR